MLFTHIIMVLSEMLDNSTHRLFLLLLQIMNKDFDYNKINQSINQFLFNKCFMGIHSQSSLFSVGTGFLTTCAFTKPYST